jgi:hypothetical protein
VADENHQLVFITGESGSGKSASLMDIRNQKDYLYLNFEAGKRLPFKNTFQNFRIQDPYQAYEAFDFGTGNPDVAGMVIDTATFMMDMFESQYVLGAANTMKAWGDYAQFWKTLLQDKVVKFEKPVIILAHTRSELDEAAMENRTQVPIKGSLKNNGLEAYFSTVVSTKKMQLKALKEYIEAPDSLLKITEDDELLGFKYVFQTRLTKQTVGERIRSPMGLFSRGQTFMNNDCQALLDHLNRFYGI